MKPTFTCKTRLTFNGLHGIITKKLELFITTGVNTSDCMQKVISGVKIFLSLQGRA
jgi:hypothetical protein